MGKDEHDNNSQGQPGVVMLVTDGVQTDSPPIDDFTVRKPFANDRIRIITLNITRWSSATLVMASTWPAVCSTEEMLSPRMSTLPLPPSRPRGASSLLTGVQLDSRLESTTSLPLLSQEVTKPRLPVPSACCPTPLPLLRPGLDLTTSLTSCTPRGLSFTGMSERVWKKESSPRLVRILPLLRRTTRRLVLTLLRLKMVREMNIKLFIVKIFNIQNLIEYLENFSELILIY